ncbi:MAG: DUF2878 domain-containing protein [Gammaproteobacteria bacterium]|nr:DUF2878 domain-containing protein [Gammaproteobacteria bacterium]
MNKVINFILFQTGWFTSVLLGTTTYYYLGPVAVAAILVYHLKTIPSPSSEIPLLMFALIIGLVWENLLTFSGLLLYPNGQLQGMFAPLWIIAMWPLLAITLNFSLRWLKGNNLLAMAFGAIGGPLAFWAGERLGAVEFADFFMAMTVLAIGWALLFPLLMKLSAHYDGYVLSLENSTGDPA